MSNVGERLRIAAEHLRARVRPTAVEDVPAETSLTAANATATEMSVGQTYRVGETIQISGGWAPLTIGGLYGYSGQRQMRESAKEPSAEAVAPSEDLDAVFTEDYRTIAAELGLDVTPIESERFKGWLSERGLTTYPRAEVEEYLHFKYQVPVGNVTNECHWGWRPLRDADRNPKAASNIKNGAIQRQTKPYAKPIPMPVLLTIRDIRTSFPDAKFFVSDEMHAERIPDPFLMVEIGHERFIVERWDEPSFRGKQA